ncbi:MAG: DUF4838 domain-containing protein [Deltaproteobacteria bacterium]|nr:DUF4838 domain-containing protein [Deltaproteobacteria bacterium]
MRSFSKFVFNLIILACVLTGVCFAKESGLNEFDINNTSAVIVLHYTDDPTISKSAFRFSSYINKILSVKIDHRPVKSPINFFQLSFDRKFTEKTLPSRDRIKNDGFHLKVSEEKIDIVALKPSGIIFGIAQLLEEFGFRFYLPNELGTIYPRPPLKATVVDLVSNPAFRFRSIGKTDWSYQVLRSNVNIESIPEDKGERIWGYFHSTDIIFPKALNISNPEYFAIPSEKYQKILNTLNKNKILPATFGIKIRTTHPEVIQKTASHLAELSKSGRYSMLTLGLSDGRGFDTRKEATKLDESFVKVDRKVSRRVVLFYNAVAKAYRAKGGEIPIRVGFYDIYNAPPKDKSIELEPELVPYITHFYYSQTKPITDSLHQSNVKFKALIEAWAYYKKPLFFYEYLYKVNWLELPWMTYPFLKDNLTFLAGQGTIGFLTQFSEKNAFSNLLNYYLVSKLLWKPNSDIDKIKEEFFHLFYGDSAPIMEQVYWMLEQDFYNSPGIHGHAKKNFTRVFQKYTLNEALRISKEELGKSHDKLVKERIQIMTLWLEYTVTMREILDGNEGNKQREKIRNIIATATEKNYLLFDQTMLQQSLHNHLGFRF